MPRSFANVAILGGGPAGMSAALWLKNMGHNPFIIEPCPQLGGMQQFNTLENTWVLGQPHLAGPDLAKTQARHLAECDVSVQTETRVLALEPASNGDQGFCVITAHAQRAEHRQFAHAVLIASGTRTHTPDDLLHMPAFQALPTSQRAVGHACFVPTHDLLNQRVLIIGGGDNAFENASHVARYGGHATLLVRNTPRAQSHFRAQCAALSQAGQVVLHEHTQLQTLAPNAQTFDARVTQQGQSLKLGPFHRLHVLTGYLPNSDFLREVLPAQHHAQLQFDAAQYILTDPLGRTPIAGLYAAGDIANPQHPCVVSAISSGAAAARAIERDFHATLA